MLKNKLTDYIFAMITGISVSIIFWACTINAIESSADATIVVFGQPY